VGARFIVDIVVVRAYARLVLLGVAPFSLVIYELIAVLWSFFHGLVGWGLRSQGALGWETV
jgi:hypothetical protein